jgi:hypothetical protein
MDTAMASLLCWSLPGRSETSGLPSSCRRADCVKLGASLFFKIKVCQRYSTFH